jgi:hypothetical protein
MEMNDLILISVDDHVIEPPDMFKQHLSAADFARAPKMNTMRSGSDSWIYEGRSVPNFGLNAVVGRPPEEYGMEPASYSQIRKGTYMVQERIDDMNVNGVLTSINFPTFPSFGGTFFLQATDKEFTKKIISAYNDWHIDEWCGAAPGRFIPLAILPLWDIDACVAEAKRVAAKGCRTISFLDTRHHAWSFFQINQGNVVKCLRRFGTHDGHRIDGTATTGFHPFKIGIAGSGFEYTWIKKAVTTGTAAQQHQTALLKMRSCTM